MENEVRRLLRERVGQVPPCGVISLDCDYRDAEQGAHVRSSLAFRKRALAVVGSSEWLGCRVGGQGDLADQYDLLSALSSVSALSLVIGLLYSSRAAGCKLAAPSLDAMVRNPALMVLGGSIRRGV
jgi:hypothetical protein